MRFALKAVFVAAFLFSAPMAFGQGGVQQSGVVAPGHLAIWGRNGVIMDGGQPAILSGPILYAANPSYAGGVKPDGVTPNDAAMKSATDACAALGATLILPPGQILLNGHGNVTTNLRNCSVVGSGVPGGTLGIPGSYGTMFLLTSTSVKPFNIGNNWSMSSVNFFWPNQTTGTQFYPPLFSPATETADTHDWYLDHVNIINAYDGVVTGGGRFNVTDSNIYAMRDAFRVGNIGDSFRLTGIHFTPGPWFTMTNNTAPYTNVSGTNTMIHAQTGGNNVVNFAAFNIGAFAWGNFVKVDSATTAGEIEFDVLLDTVQTVIDASASGAAWAGASQTPIRGSAGCYSTCFKMGASSTLFIDGWTGGSSKTFVETAGSNVYLDNVFAPGVGSIADGGDYYFVHLTANPGGGAVISLHNNTVIGLPSSTKVHGVTTDVAAARIDIQGNSFQYLNDDINVQSAATTIIGGNWSIATQGTASVITSTLLSGGHGISWFGNLFDKPPQAMVTSCGTGCTVQGGFAGFIAIGSTNPTTGFQLTLPFTPLGPGGGACTFTPSIGVILGGGPTGVSPPTWNIGSSADIHGAQIFYNCGGISQQ